MKRLFLFNLQVRLILSAKEPLDKLFVTNEAMNDHDTEAKRMLMDDLGLNGVSHILEISNTVYSSNASVQKISVCLIEMSAL